MIRGDNSSRCCVCYAAVGDVIKKSTDMKLEVQTVEKVDMLYHCSKCQFMLYCSQECQNKDWKNHKVICLAIGNVGKRIKHEATLWKGNEPVYLESSISRLHEPCSRREWWGRFANSYMSPGLVNHLAVCCAEDVKDKTAVDLGCGNGIAVPYLLEKGWKVIGVDYSEQVLNHLKKTLDKVNPKWLSLKQLTLSCSSMESFQIPAVDLVIAGSSLPYCNPKKIYDIMVSIFHALKPGGQFIGNFFASAYIKQTKGNEEEKRAMGAWLLENEDQTSTLLKGHGFVVKKCEYGGELNPGSIVFVAEKSA